MRARLPESGTNPVPSLYTASHDRNEVSLMIRTTSEPATNKTNPFSPDFGEAQKVRVRGFFTRFNTLD